MESLLRSSSISAVEVTKLLRPSQMEAKSVNNGGIESASGVAAAADGGVTENGETVDTPTVSGNPFSFASSETSQHIMERILSQSSQEVSPRTSGRLSHSSGPLNGGSLSDSPPVSPSQMDDIKFCRLNNSVSSQYRSRVTGGNGGGKTVGRWLKDRREKKKEDMRARNAQLHAAISVAGVAAAVAAIAAATASSAASSSGTRRDEQRCKTDKAVALAATLVAAQCAEAAEALGAEREHLASIVTSAVNVQTPDDIITLTAAATTALRGAATLKARAMKEVWNIVAILPVEKRMGNGSHGEELTPELNHLNICACTEMLSKGIELLKRTRKGDLHWKIVSVYIDRRTCQVTVKMKSRHVVGAITKKKKNVVLGVCKEMAAWPGRQREEGGGERRYFGLKTVARGVVEFECKNQKEYEACTQGVEKLLLVAAADKYTPGLR